MQSLKLFFITLGFFINAQTILSMNSTDYNQIKKIADYITIELKGNKQAQMLPEEFARLCEQSVTVQNDITYLVGKDSILDAEGKLTVNYSQLPEHYSLSMIDEDTFAELLSYIVYGKIDKSIQDDCLCKLIKIANFLDMPQLLNESTQLLAERVVSDQTLSFLINKTTFEKYYQDLNIPDEIQKKELVAMIGRTRSWKQAGIHLGPRKMSEFNITLTLNSFTPVVTISPDNSFIVTNSDDNQIKLWNKEGQQITSFNAESHIINVAINTQNQIITLNDRNEIMIWDRAGRLMHRQTLQFQGALYHAAIISNNRLINPYQKTLHAHIIPHRSTVKLFNFITGEVINQFEHNGFITASAVNDNGTLLATSTWDNDVHIWDIKTGKLKNKFKFRKDWFTAEYVVDDLFFDVNNEHIIIVTPTSLSMYNLLSGNRLLTVSNGNYYLGRQTKCGETVIINGDEWYNLLIISPLTKSIIHTIKIRTAALALSPDENFLVAISGSGKAQVWDLMHVDLLDGLSLKQVHVIMLILSKKVTLNKLPNHLQEVYETLPSVVKSAMSNANLK